MRTCVLPLNLSRPNRGTPDMFQPQYGQQYSADLESEASAAAGFPDRGLFPAATTGGGRGMAFISPAVVLDGGDLKLDSPPVGRGDGRPLTVGGGVVLSRGGMFNCQVVGCTADLWAETLKK